MFCKLIRLGRDAELRSTPAGKQVLQFAGAYDVGYGDNKKTQWVDCALWGDRGEKLVSHLTKGSQVVINADDLLIETWDKDDGSQGFKLKCRVVNLEFAGNKPQQTPAQQQSQAAQQPQQQQQGQAATKAPVPTEIPGFDDLEDIPF